MIRLYEEKDFEALTVFWFDAMNVAMPELQKRMGYTLEDARGYFRNIICAETQIWVYELNHEPVGYLAISGDFIDRLYVHPAHHRQGIGLALLNHARTLSPRRLWLYTHVANKMARAFYEKNGFTVKKFGVSPPPESEPDVEYHWRGK